MSKISPKTLTFITKVLVFIMFISTAFAGFSRLLPHLNDNYYFLKHNISISQSVKINYYHLGQPIEVNENYTALITIQNGEYSLILSSPSFNVKNAYSISLDSQSTVEFEIKKPPVYPL